MRSNKSGYVFTCSNCARLAVRQGPVDLTLLENSCRYSSSKNGRCKEWTRRHYSLQGTQLEGVTQVKIELC
jgi:hypothetical protein